MMMWAHRGSEAINRRDTGGGVLLRKVVAKVSCPKPAGKRGNTPFCKSSVPTEKTA